MEVQTGPAQLPLRPLATHESPWAPDAVACALNARLDARLVPSEATPDGLRVDYAHVVVLDNFLGEAERQELLDLLTAPDWDHSQGPPPSKWERETADGAGLPKTWGLQDHMLHQLAEAQVPAVREVHTRLCRLYPECDIVHMPAELIQSSVTAQTARTGAALQGSREQRTSQSPGPAGSSQTARPRLHSDADLLANSSALSPGCPSQQDVHRAETTPTSHEWCPGAQSKGPRPQAPLQGAGPAEVDCGQFVGNAPVYGDCYSYHVDADPASLPDGPWTRHHGSYVNGEPGKPLFVSLLLYLDDRWPRDWQADTLFLDDECDVGLVVRPKRFRAVLMDQDVLHRVSTPSQLAGGRPRYSLVWKLVFLPRHASQTCCIARHEWGPPTNMGSAAKLEATKRALMRKRKVSQQLAPDGPLSVNRRLLILNEWS